MGIPKIQFLGAAGTVTGSRFLLTCGETKVMVDAGMFQGLKELRLKNWNPLPIDPAEISAVVLTHAHLDHCGYIPKLVKDGFKGKVYLTEFTGKLAEGATATDLVLTVTEMLRKKGVVGKFVEFYGEGVSAVPLANRATIGNMSPEYGSTAAIFPIDDETLRYLLRTGRKPEHVRLVERYIRIAPPDSPQARFTFIECLSNIRDVEGRPKQMTSKDPGFIPDPDASTPWPGQLQVDYVRAYSRG